MILKNLNIVGKDKSEYNIRIKDNFISGNDRSGISEVTENEFTLDLKDCIAFPGLINSHDHLEFNLYPRLGHRKYNDYVEWGNDIHIKDKKLIDSVESVPVELRMKYGVIKNLICGVTAVAHHGNYNSVLDDSPVTIIRKGTCIHSVKLGGKWKIKLNLPINREPYVIHIGEGTSSGSAEEINELIRWNLFNRKLIGIHGIAMTDEQSKKFAALVWCPDSNLFLFGKTADIRSLKNNTEILFGTDSTLTAEGNIFENLRTARKLNCLSDEELFHSVTETAADVWELIHHGRISKGYKADLVVALKKSEDLYQSFYDTNPEDILLILKDGKIKLFDESLKSDLNNEFGYTKNFSGISIKGKLKFECYGVKEIVGQIKDFISDFDIDL